MTQAISEPERLSQPVSQEPAEQVRPQRRMLSAAEYLQLAELGAFDQQHVELVEGQIIFMSPLSPKHMVVVDIASQRLREAFAGLGYPRSQGTYEAGPMSRPEPDLTVIRGQPRDYLKRLANPADTLLLVEVSLSTLAYDRDDKLKVYAKAGVSEYWILDLNSDQLEVYREPHEDAADGWRYRQVSTLGLDQSVSPLARPDHMIPVRELLT